MLSSSFLSPVMKLNLPKAFTQDTRDTQRLVVTIDKDGNFFVNREAVAGEDLRETIARRITALAEKSIDLKGDGDVAYRYFVQAMDAARRAGASHINIVHEGPVEP